MVLWLTSQWSPCLPEGGRESCQGALLPASPLSPTVVRPGPPVVKEVSRGGSRMLPHTIRALHALFAVVMFCQGKSSILATTKTIFESIREDPNVDLLSAKDQIALYEEARDLEARNRDEYIARAKAATNPKVRALFELV